MLLALGIPFSACWRSLRQRAHRFRMRLCWRTPRRASWLENSAPPLLVRKSWCTRCRTSAEYHEGDTPIPMGAQKFVEAQHCCAPLNFTVETGTRRMIRAGTKLRRKGERFVFAHDPDRNDTGLAALFSVRRIGHRRKRTDRHGHLDCVRAER